MAVKEVNSGNINSGGTSPKPIRALTLNSIPGLQSTQTPPSNAPTDSETTGDLVSVSHTEGRPSQQHQQFRVRLNRAIEATNVASEAVDDIGRIVTGIEGIVEQVNGKDVPPQRVSILEKEAQGLGEEIVRAANVTTSDGLKPLAGDPIRLELEETLGKALEILLPDKGKDGFGLKGLGLSTKDVILDTVAKIEGARRQLEQLRTHLDTGASSLRTTAAALEVASQNREASQTSVRDVEDAVDLARDTRGEIKKDPDIALGSVGDISRGAPNLLV